MRKNTAFQFYTFLFYHSGLFSHWYQFLILVSKKLQMISIVVTWITPSRTSKAQQLSDSSEFLLKYGKIQN